MPFPFMIGKTVAAANAGAQKVKQASDAAKELQRQHNETVQMLTQANRLFLMDMDRLGGKELRIIRSFESFSDAFEQLKSRPVFRNAGASELPEYNAEEVKQLYGGAGCLLAAMDCAPAGTAGSFAAAGAASAAALSFNAQATGKALTDKTLTALGGGGAVAGYGAAVGAAVLGATTGGIGLLIGGVVYIFAESRLSAKMTETRKELEKEKEQARQICSYMQRLQRVANRYWRSIDKVEAIYRKHLQEFTKMVDVEHRTDWNSLTTREKRLVENTVLLVNLLHKMCNVKLVEKTEETDGLNTIDTAGVENMIRQADSVSGRLPTL